MHNTVMVSSAASVSACVLVTVPVQVTIMTVIDWRSLQ